MPLRHTRDALFLDVDGTLLDIAPTPEAVCVPAYLTQLLHQVWMMLDGGLALITGRPLGDVDRLFAPHRFPGAGMHGYELRRRDCIEPALEIDANLIHRLHDACRSFVGQSPGVLVEYKSCGAAIHYRLAPDAEQLVCNYATSLLPQLDGNFQMLRGKSVCEIKPRGCSKGTSVLELMKSAPFQGRRPVYIGDDVTDEDGFEVVNRLGGISIRVGLEGTSRAQQRFSSPKDVHRLLAVLIEENSGKLHEQKTG